MIDANEIIMDYNLPTRSKFKIEPQTMEVLQLLIEARGDIVLRKRLLKNIWNDYEGGEEGINQAISKLRKIFFDDAKNSKIIETISKRGYRIIAKIEQEHPPDISINDNHGSFENKYSLRIVALLEYLKSPKHLFIFVIVSIFLVIILLIIYRIIYALVWS